VLHIDGFVGRSMDEQEKAADENEKKGEEA